MAHVQNRLLSYDSFVVFNENELTPLLETMKSNGEIIAIFYNTVHD